MTRINASIPPAMLCNKHLIAEHREIKRIPNMITSGKANLENIPSTFTLGKGHVKFFYNKLEYLANRYERIYKECINRGFKVTYYGEAFRLAFRTDIDLWNDWTPCERVRQELCDRINERLNIPLSVGLVNWHRIIDLN